MPIPLSQPQFLAIANAAAALFPGDRDPFIAALAAALEGQPIGDGTIGRAIRDVQCRFDRPEPEHMPGRWQRDKPRFERGPSTRSRPARHVVLVRGSVAAHARAPGASFPCASRL